MSFNIFEACKRFKEEEAAIRFLQEKGKAAVVPDGDVKRLAAGRKFLYEGCLFHTGQVGTDEGSRSHILMELWIYENVILFPGIRDEQQLCGWIAEMPS
uniref:Uncharacterized protein n=1 Tax=Trichuris muris TaxID=70415 RepID=A0A5S6QBB8_TRIMR